MRSNKVANGERRRLTCLDLPEAYEEQAWAGTRWMVRKKNFAHVLMIDRGWPLRSHKKAIEHAPKAARAGHAKTVFEIAA